MESIEKILKHKIIGNKIQYFVKWENWNETHNEWITNTDHCHGIIIRCWEEKHRKRALKEKKRKKKNLRKNKKRKKNIKSY